MRWARAARLADPLCKRAGSSRVQGCGSVVGDWWVTAASWQAAGRTDFQCGHSCALIASEARDVGAEDVRARPQQLACGRVKGEDC